MFGYISGQNRANASVAMTAPVVQAVASESAGRTAADGGSQKVAMTAPVVQRPSGDGDFVVAFVLPASMTAETAPEPTNPQVEIHTVPASLAAVISYSGGWSQSGFDRHNAQLQQAVLEAGLTPIGPPRFARFDPPFKPWFLRHNEVVQDVQNPE